MLTNSCGAGSVMGRIRRSSARHGSPVRGCGATTVAARPPKPDSRLPEGIEALSRTFRLYRYMSHPLALDRLPIANQQATSVRAANRPELGWWRVHPRHKSRPVGPRGFQLAWWQSLDVFPSASRLPLAVRI